MINLINNNIAENSDLKRFPEYYFKSEQSIFDWHESDIKEIAASIINYETNIIHGNAGVGKTYILKSQLIPAFKKEGWEAVYIESYLLPVKNTLKALSAEIGFNPEIEYQRNNRNSIHQILKCLEETTRNQKVIICFDQFEKLFQKYKKKSQPAVDFLYLIEKIIENKYPNIRLVFLMRDDYLPELINNKLNISSSEIYRFGSLDEKSSRMAVLQTLSVYSISIEDELVEKILDTMAVYNYEPMLLKILIKKLISASIFRNNKTIRLSIKDFEKTGGISGIVKSSLNAILEKNQDANLSVIHGILASMIEPNFLEHHDTVRKLRTSLTLASDKDITSGLLALTGELVNSSILRRYNEYSKRTGAFLVKYELVDVNLSLIMAEWLTQNSEMGDYLELKKIIHVAAHSTIWQHNHCAYLSYEQLDILSAKFNQIPDYDTHELRYFLESAAYRQHPILADIYIFYGAKNSLKFLYKSLKSSDTLLITRAAQSVIELSKKGINLESLAECLLDLSLSNNSTAIRKICGSALALVHTEQQLKKIITETKSIRFSLFNTLITFLSAIFSQFKSGIRIPFEAKNRADRALDIIVCFHMLGVTVQPFRGFLRRKSYSLYLKRTLYDKRKDIQDWIEQGRIIGISSAFKWFFSLGLVLLIVSGNIHFLDAHQSTLISLIYIFVVIINLVLAGIFIGRSISKTAFIKHEIKARKKWYLYVIRNRIYIFFQLLFLLSSFLLVNNYTSTKVIFYFFSPFIFLSLIPILVQILNSINLKYFPHKMTINSKSYLGSSIILFIGIVSNSILYSYYHDDKLFFFILTISAISSVVFMIMYSTITFLTSRSATETVKNILTRHQKIIFTFNNSMVILLSILLIAFSSIQQYGMEAILGPWYSHSMQYDNNKKLLYVNDVFDKGPADANYYSFNIPGSDPALLTIPTISGSPALSGSTPNNRILIDGKKRIDMQYSAGESYIISPGNHFLVTKNDAKNSIPIQLNFSLKVNQIPPIDFTIENSKALRLIEVSNYSSRDLKGKSVVWKKQPGSTSWVTKFTIGPGSSTDNLQLTLLKNMYTMDLKQSLEAVITTVTSEKNTELVKMSIIRPVSMEHIPNDRFYYAKIRDIEIFEQDGEKQIKLFLSGKNLDQSMATLKTIIFMELSN